MLRLAFDATSLHGTRTGVGRFTESVLGRLAGRRDLEITAFSVSWAGRGDLGHLVPANVRVVSRPMAARPLRAAWKRADAPPLEWWTGPVDLVHGPNFVVPPARRARRLATVHDLTPWRFPHLATADTLAYPALVSRSIASGAWIHAVSRFVADEIRAEYPSVGDRVVVVPNGLEPVAAEQPATAPGRGHSLAGSDRYVLALGTVEPRKGLPGLVAAFDAVADADPHLVLVLAGPDGWGADALTRAVDRSPHAARVRRLGFVSEADRLALLRGATVFAFPSVYEGFGLPPLEAMQAGVPVLTTTAGALPEVVGDAAELVPPSDPDALAAGLERLLTDDGRRHELVTAGTARVAQFSWDATADALADCYQRIVQAPT